MLNTILFGLQHTGRTPFLFAGFKFPKYVWTLPRGSMEKRLDEHKRPICGAYYHAPTPVAGRNEHGIEFYLGADGMPGMRWNWCDDVDGSGIQHTGWFSDWSGDETIRGVVFRLSHGRGFLAGWSMGVGMSSVLECTIYDDAVDAARAADSIAENAAEAAREYQERQQENDEE